MKVRGKREEEGRKERGHKLLPRTPGSASSNTETTQI